MPTAPTLVATGTKFALKMKGEDRWGNPSDKCDTTLSLNVVGDAEISGLPKTVTFKPGLFA